MTYWTCPICGYDRIDEPPYTEIGSGSHDCCPCCDFEYGFHDDAEGYSHEEWRKKWIAEGMKWHNDEVPVPPDWDPIRQLRNVEVER